MRKRTGKCTGVHKVGRKRFCLLPNHCNPSALFALFAPLALFALCTICTVFTLCTICTVALFALCTICTLGSMLLADGPKSQFFTTPEVFCDTHCAQCTANSPTEKNLKVHNCCKNKEQEQDWKPGHFSVCKHRVHFGRLPFTKCLLPLIPCLL